MTELDLDRIQGFVVRGYRLPLAGYIFLRIDDRTAAAAWISEITDEVLTAAPWSAKPDSGVNLAFSYAGLTALRLPSATLASFPEEFRDGMAARASVLGDEGDSAPANWQAPLGTQEVHVLVMISAADEPALSAHDQRLRDSIQRAGGMTVIYDEVGRAMPEQPGALRLRRRVCPARHRGGGPALGARGWRPATGRKLAPDPRG